MTHYKNYDKKLKIILAGNSRVGKSTLFKRITDQEYMESIPTVGVDYKCLYKNYDDKKIKICIWDTAGQERFKNIIKSYFNQVAGIILMFDLSNYETYVTLQEWIDLINKENRCDHEHPILLIGNKSDSTTIIHPNKQLEILKNSKNIIYKEVSCLKWNQSSLETLFDSLITLILNNNKNCKGIDDVSDCDTINLIQPTINSKKKWFCNLF